MVEMRMSTLPIAFLVFSFFIISGAAINIHFQDTYEPLGGASFVTDTLEGTDFESTYSSKENLQVLVSNISDDAQGSEVSKTTLDDIPIIGNLWRILRTMSSYMIGSTKIIEGTATSASVQLGFPDYVFETIIAIIAVLVVFALINLFTRNKG